MVEIIKEKAFYGFLMLEKDLPDYIRNPYWYLDKGPAPKPKRNADTPEDTSNALAVLDNGTWLLVREGGTAVDQSGRIYARVSEEVGADPMPADDPLLIPYSLDELDDNLPEALPIPDTDLVTLGWTPDCDAPIILRRVDGELRIVE